MNALHVISSFPPAYAYGGPVKSSYEVCKELVDRGHDVTVYTTDVLDGSSRQQLETNPESMDGIEVFRFRNLSNDLSYQFNLPIAPMLGLRLRNHLAAYDLVHVHEYRTFQAVFARYYAEQFDVPFVLQPRGAIPRIGKNRQKRVFDTLFGEPVLRDADRIIETSEFASDRFTETFPWLDREKTAHLPNGIDWTTYQCLPPEGEFRDEFSIVDDREVIFYLGRIHRDKGLDLLVEAFERASERLDEPLLVIGGPDNGYREELEALVRRLGVEADVLFPGPLYEEAKLEAYVDADVFVLPSKYESFGNVALEAMACGTPVVLTSSCGIAEYLDEDVGITVEYDVRTLEDALCDTLSTETDRREAGERGRTFAKNFDWSEIAGRLEGIYDDLLAAQG